MSVENQMNLCALQRVDPYIERIITSASQVALYKFASNEWEKTETEGTLFVYERNCDPQYGFLILNRRSTRNLVEPVTKELDFQLQTPFLLYKTKEGKIFGIWFYEQSECERVSATVQELVEKTEQKLNKNAKGGRAGGSGNLAMLLNKAQNKESSGNEKLASSSRGNMPPSNGADKLMNLLTKATSEDQGPREAQPPSPPALLSNQVNGASRPQAQKPQQEAKAEDGNVAAFFAKAASAEQQSQQREQHQEQQSAFTSPSSRQQHQPSTAAEAALPPPPPPAPLPGQVPPGIPLMGPPPPAPLMAAAAAAAAGLPPVMMQPHMMAAAAAAHQHAAMMQQAQMMAAAAAQQQLRQQQQLQQQQQQQPNQGPPPVSTASPNPGDKTSGASPNPVLARLLSNPEAISLENIERQQRFESVSPQLPKMPATARCAEDLEQKLKIVEAAPKTSKPPKVAQEQKKQQLDQQQQQQGGRGSYASAVVNPAVAATREQPKLISPAQLAKAIPGELTHVLEGSERRQKDLTATTTNGEGHFNKVRSVEPLTITQMTQALEYLIKTDKEFVTKLHRAYVDSLNDKLHQ